MGLPPITPPWNRSIVEGAGAQFAGSTRLKAPGEVVAPLIASTTRMPLAVVRAPGPPTLVTCTDVLPVAAPPLMTNLSEGEPSPPEECVDGHRPAGANVVAANRQHIADARSGGELDARLD